MHGARVTLQYPAEFFPPIFLRGVFPRYVTTCPELNTRWSKWRGIEAEAPRVDTSIVFI
jgi:hypothetical protein